jgi:hypothetical protein
VALLQEFLGQEEIADYLRECLPDKVVGASDVWVLPLSEIEQEMTERAPGFYIRRYGYVVIATSVGGNAICFHNPSGKEFWVNHSSFSDDTISYKDRNSGEWKYIYEYNPVNVETAMIPLSDSIPKFLDDLLSDKLRETLDALD